MNERRSRLQARPKAERGGPPSLCSQRVCIPARVFAQPESFAQPARAMSDSGYRVTSTSNEPAPSGRAADRACRLGVPAARILDADVVAVWWKGDTLLLAGGRAMLFLCGYWFCRLAERRWAACARCSARSCWE